MAALRRFAVPSLALLTILTLIGAQAQTARLSGDLPGDGARQASELKEVVGSATASSRRSEGAHPAAAGAASSTAKKTMPSAEAAAPAAKKVRTSPEVPAQAAAKKSRPSPVVADLEVVAGVPAGTQVKGRAPSIGGIDRRESALASTMRLHKYEDILKSLGPIKGTATVAFLVGLLFLAARRFFSREMLITILYCIVYLIASPMAIMANKILMKDKGFGYPVLISSLGQSATAICAALVLCVTGETLNNARKIGIFPLAALGCVSALALVLGQYPYFYLTVAFIQMLKAFSPAYMIVFLFCLGIESPSRRVIACVLGLCVCTAVASAGEVNFSLVGVVFMTVASCSDALRLVIAQKLLKKQKMGSFEGLACISPMCLLFMAPVAIFKELPAVYNHGTHQILLDNPALVLASAFSGFFVNLGSFLLVKRTSGITLKLITMARNGGLVLASALCFGETITTLEAVGYAGLLFFFGAYTVVKQQENKQTTAAPGATGFKRISNSSVGSGLDTRDTDTCLRLISSSVASDDSPPLERRSIGRGPVRGGAKSAV